MSSRQKKTVYLSTTFSNSIPYAKLIEFVDQNVPVQYINSVSIYAELTEDVYISYERLETDEEYQERKKLLEDKKSRDKEDEIRKLKYLMKKYPEVLKDL